MCSANYNAAAVPPSAQLRRKNGIHSSQRILISGLSKPSESYVIFVTSGSPSIPTIIQMPCNAGSVTGQHVKRLTPAHHLPAVHAPREFNFSVVEFAFLIFYSPLHDVPPPSQQHMALVSSPIIQRAVRPAPDHLSISLPATTAPPSGSVPSSSSLAREFRAVDNHAPQESHHQTGENRAATLRADPLLREVEPDRVFCTLCQKWVQLRQDTSYCAYPWLQHRAKCLSKQCVFSRSICLNRPLTSKPPSHKMAQRSAEAAESRVRMHGRVLTDDETDWLADEGRSDGGMYASGSERRHSGITTPPSSRSRRPASSSADLLTPSGRYVLLRCAYD